MKKNHILLFAILLTGCLIGGCRKANTDKNSNIKEQEKTANRNVPFAISLENNIYPLGSKYLSGDLVNNTSDNADFGDEYILEYEQDSIWKRVFFGDQIAFNSLAYLLPAESRRNFKSYLNSEFYNYQPVNYRITKEITTVLTAGFRIIDTPDSLQNEELSHSDGYFSINVSPQICTPSTDSMKITITNHSDMLLHPHNHYFFEYYNDENEYWDRYYYPSYSKELSIKQTLLPGESIEYTVALFAQKFSKHSIIQGFRTGKYRLCKYADVYVSAEFQMINTYD